MLMLLKNILGELQNQLSIILGDSENLRKVLTHVSQMTTNPENRTIGEPLTQFSILLPDSKNI